MLTITVTRFYGPDDGVRVWIEAEGYQRETREVVPRRGYWSPETYTEELTKTAGRLAARELERYRRQL